MCGKGAHSWTVSSSAKAVKFNRFYLFSPISLPLFQVQKSIRFVEFFHAKLASQVLCSYTEYGSRLMANEEKSTLRLHHCFQVNLFQIYYNNIPEKGYYWQNEPNNLKVKGYQEVNSNIKQLHCTEKKSCPPQSSRSHRNQCL